MIRRLVVVAAAVFAVRAAADEGGGAASAPDSAPSHPATDDATVAAPPSSTEAAPASTTDSPSADSPSVDSPSAEARHVDDEPGLLSGLQMGTFRVDAASPQGKRLGVGFTIGVPTSVTAKLMVRPQHAVVASVGAFNALALTEPSFTMNAAYEWHPLSLARAPAFALHTHVGVGGALAILPQPGKHTTIPSALYYRAPTQLWTSVRAPVGVDLVFTGAPVDVVFDVAPQVLVFPAVGVGVDVALGARVWW